MNIKRIWQTFRMYTLNTGGKRANYARRKGIYRSIGENVVIMDRKIPLYAECIKYHNNIVVASNTLLVTHDRTDKIINGSNLKSKVQEEIGCIEICDNVFIGSNVTVLNNVKIGPNCIVAAGTVVNKDLESNGIYGGVPAKKIGDFDEFVKNRLNNEPYPIELTPKISGIMKEELVDFLWEKFENQRK